MSLKHLLNPDDDPIPTTDAPLWYWDDSNFFHEPEPVLATQNWSQCVDGILTPDIPYDDYAPSIDPNLESFGYAQCQIEQWIVGGDASEQPPTHDPTQEQLICYGTIFRASLKLLGNMLDLDNKLSTQQAGPIVGHVQLQLIRHDTQYHVTFSDGFLSGEMNLQFEEVLNNILEQQYLLEFEVFASIDAVRETINKATKGKNAIDRVHINVYSTTTASSAVGREFSQRKMYLQRPDHIRHGTLYDNPHVLKLRDTGLCEFVQSLDVDEPVVESAKGQIVKETVTEVYSALTRGCDLVALEGDRRIHTLLLPHQKRALDFMSQREGGPIPDKYILWRPEVIEGERCYRHTITGMISRLQQIEIGGAY